MATSPNEKGWTTGGTEQKASITRALVFSTNNVEEGRVARAAGSVGRRAGIVATVGAHGGRDIEDGDASAQRCCGHTHPAHYWLSLEGPSYIQRRVAF